MGAANLKYYSKLGNAWYYITKVDFSVRAMERPEFISIMRLQEIWCVRHYLYNHFIIVVNKAGLLFSSYPLERNDTLN